jgi:hypothetical protein
MFQLQSSVGCSARRHRLLAFTVSNDFIALLDYYAWITSTTTGAAGRGRLSYEPCSEPLDLTRLLVAKGDDWVYTRRP